MEFEKLLSELFASFVNIREQDFDERIRHALRRIGEALEADRCHLLHFAEDRKEYVTTHSWVAEGLGELRAIGIGTADVPWIYRNFAVHQKIFQCSSLLDLPEEAREERELAVRFGTRSIMIIPILDNIMPAGAFVLEQVRSERVWPPELIPPLERIAEVLLNVLLKKRSEEKLRDAFREIRRLKEQVESERNCLQEEIQLEHDFENIIGRSHALRRVLRKVEQAAPTDTTVLILGETGTGKELMARAVHDKSRRRSRPLIKVNCASLSPNLIESELFGHEKGAFTGAHTARKGRFELADGATLFLDEIGELALETQGKLLRVLQEGEFERIGSSCTLKADVRIIAATNRDLAQEVEKGCFRRDLWYRLNVFPITLPPLRQRPEDIPLLVQRLLGKLSKKLGRPIESVSAGTMRTLVAYEWPGNVRELENVLERAVIGSPGPELRLPETLETPSAASALPGRRKTLQEVEREYILETLKETKGQVGGKNGAAALLNLPTSTLRARMKKLGIPKP
ncbi:MAG: sigma-54-dependent Fis family transcriptional regulator [Thermodesulfobacteriota bacterium]